MKGLILKDFYMIVKYCRAYLLIAAVFIAVSFAGDGNMFFVAYPCLLSGMIPITLLAYDERSKWHEYSGTLPYSKAQIVSGKYLTGLIMQLAILVLTGIVQAVKMSVSGVFDLKEYMTLLTMLLILSCTTSALCLPLIFKWGVEKGRIAYYVGIGIIISTYFTVMSILGGKLPEAGRYGGILPLAGIAVYALSWWLSVVFYKKREI